MHRAPCSGRVTFRRRTVPAAPILRSDRSRRMAVYPEILGRPTSPGPSTGSPTRSWNATATQPVVLLGIPTRGVYLARRLADRLTAFTGRADPGRLAGHHPVPRRPAPAPAAGAGGDPAAGRRHRRRDRRAGRRRAVLRPHHPGRARRAARPRPARGRAAGRAGRPGAPAAADPRRLRRQEHPDRVRRRRGRATGRDATAADCRRPGAEATDGRASASTTTIEIARRPPAGCGRAAG